jgi:hypothetical protein
MPRVFMRIPIALLVVSVSAAPAYAQDAKPASAPAAIKSVAAIPMYPGAERVAAQPTDVEGWEQFSSMMKDQLDSLRSEEMISYEVLAHPEVVYTFYRDKLGGQEYRMWSDFDYTKLAHGGTTVVFRHPWFWIKPSENTKTVFATRPTFEKPDQWVCIATFMWLVKEQSGDVTGIMVAVRDAGTIRSAGIAKKPLSYSPRTRIVIKRATWVDPDKVPGKFAGSYGSPFYCF